MNQTSAPLGLRRSWHVARGIRPALILTCNNVRETMLGKIIDIFNIRYVMVSQCRCQQARFMRIYSVGHEVWGIATYGLGRSHCNEITSHEKMWGITPPPSSAAASMCCPFLFPLQHGTSVGLSKLCRLFFHPKHAGNHGEVKQLLL